MEAVELSCEKRAVGSKSTTRSLRRAGRVPVVLYGPAEKSAAMAVTALELAARVAASGRQPLMRLKSGAADLDGQHVILKEVQRAPVSGKILHADFYRVDLNKPLRVSVPFKFSGRAVGVADGGVLQPLVREATVECLPLEIPEFIEVEVSELGIHDVVHISAVTFAGNIKPVFDSDYAVVTVLPPTVAEVPVAAAAAAVEGVLAEGAPAEGAPAEGAPAAAAAAPAAEAAGAKKAEPAKKAEAAKK